MDVSWRTRSGAARRPGGHGSGSPAHAGPSLLVPFVPEQMPRGEDDADPRAIVEAAMNCAQAVDDVDHSVKRRLDREHVVAVRNLGQRDSVACPELGLGRGHAATPRRARFLIRRSEFAGVMAAWASTVKVSCMARTSAARVAVMIRPPRPPPHPMPASAGSAQASTVNAGLST